MTVYAIGDLHLPGGDVKPMDVFGSHWERHFERICEDWRARVGEEDVVLLPGDLSWAMHMEDALEDLRKIGELPGRKILIKGNHDFWWSSISRLREALPRGMYALQNDCVQIEDTVFCGSRGWVLPGQESGEQDLKIYNRERIRLEMALKAARAASGEGRLIAMMHYPPLLSQGEDTGFTALMEQYRVDDVVYGHLHGVGIRGAFRGEHGGVRYHLVSCDALDFKLYAVPDHGAGNGQSGT